MLEHLNLALWAAQLSTRFRVHRPAVELTLAEATDLGSTARQERFSLLFRGPLETFLPQGIYQLEHDQLGSISLFLVPVGREPQGYAYEAVFNRLLERGVPDRLGRGK